MYVAPRRESFPERAADDNDLPVVEAGDLDELSCRSKETHAPGRRGRRRSLRTYIELGGAAVEGF